jgi:hypothetical protein
MSHTQTRTWTKVRAGVYASGGYTVEKRYDRASGGWQWRLRNQERPERRYYEWFPTLADAKDFVALWDGEAD